MLAAFEKVVIVFPELYPASSKTQAIRRAVLSKQLSVFYSFTADKISIIAILDNRMDAKKWT